MTRILVLGNSHTAALKNAEEAFYERHPDIKLSFFAVSEPYFSKGVTDAAGVYTPPEGAQVRNNVQLEEGCRDVDFNLYDHVLVVGLRTPHGLLCDVLAGHGVLDGAQAGEAPMVSKAFLREVIAHQTRQTVLGWSRLLGVGFEGAIHIAPLPSIAITDPQRRVDRRARENLALHQHPLAWWLFEEWRAAMSREAFRLSTTLLWQPAYTVAGPFVAKEEYSDGDCVHMNAAFGLTVLEAYIRDMGIA